MNLDADLIEGLEDSEVAEAIVTLAAVLYLGASQLGYIQATQELDLIALTVIATVVGVDKLLKKKRNGDTQE